MANFTIYQEPVAVLCRHFDFYDSAVGYDATGAAPYQGGYRRDI